MEQGATVKVRGQASRQVAPDFAVISVAIEGTDPDQDVAVRQVARIADNLREDVAAASGVRTFVLPRVRVQRNHRWDERRGQNVATDWTASVSGNVECVPAAVGALAAAVARAGAQVVWVSWELDRANPSYREVRREAVADAVRAAEDFAAAVGRPLGSLLTLADEGLLGGSAADAAPMFARAAAAPGGGGGQIDLDPQPQSISTAVEASFSLEG